MKTNYRKILLACVLMLCTSTAMALHPQRREVIIDTICNASIEQLLMVADSFCYQFSACPDSLFKWAYLNMEEEQDESKKHTKESRSAIQLVYKDRVYDRKQKTGDVAIDIYVLGVRWWKDNHLGTRYMYLHPVDARYPLTAHMTATYSGSILEGGDFIMRMEPLSDNRTYVHYEFGLTFGRLLSTFISDSMWHTAIEWRFVLLLQNLIECAETGTVAPKNP